jgi:hypothetical protein
MLTVRDRRVVVRFMYHGFDEHFFTGRFGNLDRLHASIQIDVMYTRFLDSERCTNNQFVRSYRVG